MLGGQLLVIGVALGMGVDGIVGVGSGLGVELRMLNGVEIE